MDARRDVEFLPFDWQRIAFYLPPMSEEHMQMGHNYHIWIEYDSIAWIFINFWFYIERISIKKKWHRINYANRLCIANENALIAFFRDRFDDDTDILHFGLRAVADANRRKYRSKGEQAHPTELQNTWKMKFKTTFVM